ncbi:MAG: MgtC/SapB family protein, partial [Planctomycetota bacterium]|jgi:putative Mg2+ transporter-C (MgtC) family protein
VLSGLGFLGGGAIIVFGRRIRGLTTAACIWVTAAIGLALGSGYVLPAVFTFLVVMFALDFLGRWETRMARKDRYVRLSLRFGAEGERLSEIEDLLAAHSLEVLGSTVDWDREGNAYRLQLRHAVPVDFEQVTAALAATFEQRGLSKVQWR